MGLILDLTMMGIPPWEVDSLHCLHMGNLNLMNCLYFPIIKDATYFAKFYKDVEALVNESITNELPMHSIKSLQKLARKKEKYLECWEAKKAYDFATPTRRRLVYSHHRFIGG